MALTDKLTAIADAIRVKTGKTDGMTLEQMPTEIAGIEAGGGSDITLLENVPFELDFASGDMSFEAPNGYAVKSAIVKKPNALIPENIAEGVEIAGIIGTHAGGGSSADVRYVTFMNGDTVLYKKPVAVGDDCVDVLTKGLISTPTKESDVQYNYTYYGWGASDGGAADANILKNITEDKTVYAIYTSTVRSYTITYLDDDGSVLKTETLVYGDEPPAYAPIKEGYEHIGWNPTLATVTGDANYVAVWKKVEYTVLLPEQSIYPVNSNGNGTYAEITGISVGIEKGATYRVTFNGTQGTHVATGYTIRYKNSSGAYTGQNLYTGVGNPWKAYYKNSSTIEKVLLSGTTTTVANDGGLYFVRTTAVGDTYTWVVYATNASHTIKVEKVE